MEIGNIVKIKEKYFEITGTSLMESYGFIDVIELNDDIAEEVQVTIDAVELVWKQQPLLKNAALPISDVSGSYSEEMLEKAYWGREDCQMCHYLPNMGRFCDYFDYGFRKCEDILICPDGLDDVIEYWNEDEYYDINENDEDEYL